jgi:diguanylate cyclase (GGDEF)-like protein/putative nucleotidyltransferase with HDIG domain
MPAPQPSTVSVSSPTTNIDAPLGARVDAGIEALGTLPVLDRSLVRVRALAEDPESSTHDLVVALEADANLAANLLRFANSAVNARPVRAATLHQAVMLIGRRAVGQRALEAQVCSFFERAPGGGGVAHGQIHIHAVQVGACAAELARRTGADASAAHLAGLLHDLGKLVLPAAFGADAVDVIATPTPAGPARVIAERDVLGIDHAAAGARFVALAGLDPDVIDAVADHHGADGRSASLVARCVQAANATVALIGGHAADHELLDEALDELGLNLAQLEEIAAAALPSAVANGSTPSTLADQVSRLEREARTDDLTSLLNRRYWSIAARERLAQQPASVLICDVDHFKRINDFHGHHTGDFVLSQIARILTAHGLAGRLGGDEFAVITATPDPDATMARRILSDIASAFPDPSLAVTISIGSATATAAGDDLSALLRQADEALYAAKRAGRGTQRAAA